MIPNKHPRELESSGVTAQGTFGISETDTSHILEILRSTLYSDKITAVLREYGSNAWDAHRSIGKGDKPIKVTLPTLADPTLSIQDFGPGLSLDDVFNVYSQYGASTKRNSDGEVGFMGIGSKSAFAYSDSFTVISCHGGVRRTFVAVLDPSERGVINLLGEEPCGDETGVTIQMAVRQQDIGEFETKARKVFQYFEPRPVINTALPDVPARLVHGALVDADYYSSGEWTAVMGCIPYQINLDELFVNDADEAGSPEECVKKLSGVLFFNIGDVQVSASREALKYSLATKKALVDKLNAFIAEYVEVALREIHAPDVLPWQRRLKAQGLRRFGLKLDKQSKELTEDYVEIVPPAVKDGERPIFNAFEVHVGESSRIIIRDDGRALSGFEVDKRGEYIVGRTVLDEDNDRTDKHGRPRRRRKSVAKRIDTVMVEAVRAALEAEIEKKLIKGIPLINLSTLPWTAPATRSYPQRQVNPKHRAKMFRLVPDNIHSDLLSDRWEIAVREPTDDDVFVILSSFKSSDGQDIYRRFRQDAEIVKTFAPGAKMPEIYGYKTTEAKPVTGDKCKGTAYDKWSAAFTKKILALPEVKAQLELKQWSACDVLRADVQDVTKALGPKHPVTVAVRKYQEGRQQKNSSALDYLVNRGTDKEDVAKQAIGALYAKYPLFRIAMQGEFAYARHQWSSGKDLDAWIQYFKLMDLT
jgi:Molecular chaperone, HSP90 family